MNNLKIQNPGVTALYTILDNFRVSSLLDVMSNLPTINMWQRKSFHGSQVQVSTRVGLRRGASNFKAYGFVN